MDFLEVREAKLDQGILSHLVRRNLSIGANFKHGLDDVLFTHSAYEQVENLHRMVDTRSKQIQLIVINAKLLTLEKVIKLVRSVESIDEKRAYLYDAFIIEEEINELIYGGS